MKKSVGIYEAKANLSKLIKIVQKQRVSVNITDRGALVAVLSPAELDDSFESRMGSLQADGVLVLSEKTQAPINTLQPVAGAVTRFLKERE